MKDAKPSDTRAFVGRRAELERLRSVWDRALIGDGCAVFVSGEAGIGKSRLIDVLCKDLIGHEHLLHVAHCRPGSINSPFQPFIGLLERAIASETTASGESSGPLVSLLLGLLAVPEGPDLHESDSANNERRRGIIHGINEWLIRQARGAATLVVVEDLHWADPSTLELLGALLDRVRSERILLILTFRPTFCPPWLARAHVVALPLEPLKMEDADELIVSMSHSADTRELAGRIHALGKGNPLIMEELAKAPFALGELGPDVLRDALSARLARCSVPISVVHACAALGWREFGAALLQAITNLSSSDVQAALNVLLELELLRSFGPARFPTYAFRHVLLQDTLYSMLADGEREGLHLRIARVYERSFVHIARANPELVAQHFSRGGDRESSIAYFERAGSLALSRSAQLEAVEHFSAAIDALRSLADSPQRAERELQLSLKLGPALMMALGYAAVETEQRYMRALDLAQSLGAVEEEFIATWGLWRIATELNGARAIEYSVALVSLADRLGDDQFRIGALHARWGNIWHGTSALQVIADTDAGLALYDARRHYAHTFVYGGHDPGVCAYAHAAVANAIMGKSRRACEMARLASELARDLEHPYILAHGLALAAIAYQLVDEVDACAEASTATIEVAAKHGLANRLASGWLTSGWSRARGGDVRGGTALMMRGAEALKRCRVTFLVPYALGLAAAAARTRGDTATAQRLIDEAISSHGESTRNFYEPELLRIQGDLLCRQRDREGARRVLRSALDRARAQDAAGFELRAACSFEGVAVTAAQHAEARAIVESARRKVDA